VENERSIRTYGRKVTLEGGHYDLTIATTSEDPKVSAGDPATSTQDAPVSTLRGATVSVDGRRARQVVVGLILATLAVLGVIFIVVGINKNDQINELKAHGVPVTYVVSKCLGLLGGSGSNGAGYSCQGSYMVDGRSFSENLPGSSLYAPGDRVKAISVRSDPTLLSTPAILDAEDASTSVFILPAVLLGACALLGLALLLQHRRHRDTAENRRRQVGGV
jgi:hypothetical protein